MDEINEASKAMTIGSDFSSKYELEKAETTELPLANRDEQPPLVVDLPEGQKLVVGRLEEGTVIEVASWRGTGRPDSRTSRLMLGVTRDESDPEIEDVKRKFLKGSKKSIAHQEQVFTKQDQVSLQASAARVSTGVNFEFVTPSATATLERVREEKKVKKMNPVKAFLLKHKVGEAVVAAVIILGVLINAIGGISIVHPRSGAALSMGRIQDSLIAIKRGSKVSVGDKIVISVANIQSPQLVIVQGVSPQSVLTNVSGKLMVVTPKQIKGKVLALFPYVGWPFNL